MVLGSLHNRALSFSFWPTSFPGMMKCTVLLKSSTSLKLLYSVVLTSPAVEAAQPLMEVLLVLHTVPVLADREVLVLFPGPLRCWRFHCSTLQPTEEGEQQHLNHPGLEETERGGLFPHTGGTQPCSVNERQGESIFIGNLV